jgi:uncharacterized membrane protein
MGNLGNLGELNFFLFITNICVVLLCGALLPLMPFLTRKSFLFGVKVPPDAQRTNEARALRRRYILVTAAGGAAMVAFCVWQYLMAPNLTIFTVMYLPLVLVVIEFAVYVPNHRKALALKKLHGWRATEKAFADTKTSFTRGNLSAMPHFWYVISLLIVFPLFVVALVEYPSLPSQIPIHWDFEMQPNAWVDKSLGAALLVPLMGLGIVALLWSIGILIEKAKLQIDFGEPAKSFAQHKKYRRWMGHACGVLAVGIAVMILLSGLGTAMPGFTVSLWLPLGVVTVSAIPIFVVSIRAGQGGALLKVSAADLSAAVVGADGGTGDANASDDDCWAWGLFYHNPNDPAYFVGNRFGVNIGFNYSRLPVKIGVATAVAALAACYIWLTGLFVSLL